MSLETSKEVLNDIWKEEKNNSSRSSLSSCSIIYDFVACFVANKQPDVPMYIIDGSVCSRVMEFCTFVLVHMYMHVKISNKYLKHMAKCDFIAGSAGCNKLKYVISSSAILPEKTQTF